ncbi:MAG: saccharopine dehydrogenase C-terminal domain-containing protein [candidate division WOR-3 bacterium]
MKKKILVLGAGLVARPLVDYLLKQSDFFVTVASRTASKAEKLIASHPRGKALEVNVSEPTVLANLIVETDLVISLVPYTFHPIVAQACIQYKKPMITTSYVGDAMRSLDQEAKAAGIIILNEIGLDPGIDHMSAMKIIHRVKNRGGRVISFYSYCGGLPAPEANNNPFGYKFSWSPKGVLLAGKNSARYLKDGKEIFIPGPELFSHYWVVEIEGLGKFEAYPNRDSLPYIELYGLVGISSMCRGTLRNLGWCETFKKIVELGLLDDKELDNLRGLTYRDWLKNLLKQSNHTDLRSALADFLKLDKDSMIVRRLEWLGLLTDEPIGLEKGANIDILVKRMQEKMSYQPGERDMIVLKHEFIAEYPKESRKEKIESTLIDFGIPNGDTAMSRTVSLPAAIAAKLILTDKIKLTGIQIPVVSEIYEPVLAELETLNIVCKEKTIPLPEANF